MVRTLGQQGFSAPGGLYSDAPGFTGPVLPKNDYDAPDEETSDTLEDIAKALAALEKLLQLASGIADAKLRADFEREVREAQRKIQQGQRTMLDASQKISEASNGIYSANDQINSLSSQLSSVQNQMGLELANISSIASSIAGIDTRLSSASDALSAAQSRYNEAMNRANYPAGSAGLAQQRNDLRAINNDIFNLNSTILDLQNTRGQEIFNMNEAGTRYNNLIPVANATRDGVASAYEMAGGFESQRAAGLQQFNEGAGSIREGYGQFLGAGEAYQNARDNILMPLAQSRVWASGASQAINQIAQGNYLSGVAEIANAGWNMGMLNPANASLAPFSGLAQGTFSSAGKALDMELRATGGDVSSIDAGRLMTNLTIEAGNRFLGVKEFQNAVVSIGDSVTLADAGDFTGASLIATTQAVPSLMYGLSTIGQTVAPFTGPLAPVIAGAIPPVRDAVNALQSGVVNTMVNAFQTPFSQPLSPSTPKTGPGERGLLERAVVGPPSAPFVLGAGALITAAKTAEGLTTSYFQNNRGIASETASQIYDIGKNPANWPPSLKPGTFQPGMTGP